MFKAMKNILGNDTKLIALLKEENRKWAEGYGILKERVKDYEREIENLRNKCENITREMKYKVEELEAEQALEIKRLTAIIQQQEREIIQLQGKEGESLGEFRKMMEELKEKHQNELAKVKMEYEEALAKQKEELSQ